MTRLPHDRFAIPALFASVGIAACLALAAAGSASDEKEFSIAVDVERVELNVTVLTPDGRLVPDLTADNFRVFEDGVEQQIRSFSALERPLNLALVIDNSRSMGPQRAPVIMGAMRLSALSHADDDIAVVHFNETPRVGLGGRSINAADAPKLREALFELRPDGMTALYDALSVALGELDRGPWKRQAAVVFSDGADNASQAALEDALTRLKRSNAMVYAIGLSEPQDPYASPKVLRQITRVSGGAAFFPDSTEELFAACERIAREIRAQYTVSYSPSHPSRDGGYRRIRVEVASPKHRKLEVRAREGYLPAEAEAKEK